ncbi:MAG: hypothetical protein COT22_05790 [Ignavibacteria bacterium CG08_land_8_20_14_0_20_37_9]|nr:MAG: hypothetical protein COT22_05790 [Ignavibacteria bacterium CG08_land_8_20_14_0_20_37_9]
MVGDIRNLSLKQIDDWFSKEFPVLLDNKERQKKSSYVEAVYKFGEFLHYGLKQWSKHRLELLRKTVRRPWVAPIWENKIEILDVAKADAFINYLKDKSRTHYMMCYLMRYANMRFIEVINAKADLKSGTFREDFKNNRVFIYGKGRGGLTQLRTTPFFEDDQKELLEFMKWREEEEIKSEWLFVNQYGRKFSENSGHFNTWLQEQGKRYGFSETEIKLLKTHSIGRHEYGTDATIKGLPEKFIADNMGIRNHKILQRYQNATDNIRIEETRKRLKGNNRNQVLRDVGCNSDEDRKKRLIDMLIEGRIDSDTFKVAFTTISSNTKQ